MSTIEYPEMPASEQEWRVYWAFYQLTIKQRDAAWREIDQLRAALDVEHGFARLAPERCLDCGVAPGVEHLDGCDMARCVVTGEQRITCQRLAERDPQPYPSHDCGQEAWEPANR